MIKYPEPAASEVIARHLPRMVEESSELAGRNFCIRQGNFLVPVVQLGVYEGFIYVESGDSFMARRMPKIKD